MTLLPRSGKPPKLTVYVARKIITMERALPQASAVAVAEGRIVGVGSLDDLNPWLSTTEYTVNREFSEQVITPGFIDPHVHPLLPAVLSQMPFAAPDAWDLPSASYPGVTTPDDFVATVRRLIAAHDHQARPFFVFGYHQLFHGDMNRTRIEAEFGADDPVFLWHRSFHEIFTNTAGLHWLDRTSVDGLADEERAGVDLAAGHFFEAGLGAIFPKIGELFLSPNGLATGFASLAAMVRDGGITTIADMGTGLFADVASEAALIRQALGRPDNPFRTMLTPIATAFRTGTPEAALAACEELLTTGYEQVFMNRHFKLMADGAFFGQQFQLGAPGYIDGHVGQWVQPTELTRSFAHAFWNAGYQLHIHANGDGGVAFSLDLLRELLESRPRPDHRFTFEHLGYCTEDQNRQLAALGATVSGQPYYLYMLGDKYAEQGLGHDRASQMCRFGSLVDKGVPLALHSDCPMAPLRPLTLVGAAVNRRTIGGNVLAPAERLTVSQALRAVTTEAAWILRLEDQIGSIRAGKRADFTILGADPNECAEAEIADIPVIGTIFDGRPFLR